MIGRRNFRTKELPTRRAVDSPKVIRTIEQESERNSGDNTEVRKVIQITITQPDGVLCPTCEIPLSILDEDPEGLCLGCRMRLTDNNDKETR